jgi:hypothetical protein
MFLSDIKRGIDEVVISSWFKWNDNLYEVFKRIGWYVEESWSLPQLIKDSNKTYALSDELREEFWKFIQWFSQSNFFCKAKMNPWSHWVIQDILDYAHREAWHSTWEYIDSFLLETPLADQHRRKIEYQWKFLREGIIKFLLWRSQCEVMNILSLWCWQSPELPLVFDKEVQELLKKTGKRVHFILLDSDKEALTISEQKAKSFNSQGLISVKTMHKNVLRYRNNEKTYDLVVAWWLFDYLESRSIQSIISRIWEHLNNEGKIFFTNIIDGVSDTTINRDEYSRIQAIIDFVILRYLIWWIMHHRTRWELEKIVQNSCGDDTEFQIETIWASRTYGVTISKGVK